MTPLEKWKIEMAAIRDLSADLERRIIVARKNLRAAQQICLHEQVTTHYSVCGGYDHCDNCGLVD